MTVDINSTPNKEDVADPSSSSPLTPTSAASDSVAASEKAAEDLKQKSKQDLAPAPPAATAEEEEEKEAEDAPSNDSNGNDHPDDGPESEEFSEERQDIIPDRIFVGNLPYEVTEDDVRNLTPEFEVVSVEIPRKNFFNRSLNKIVLQSKGYGFITYTNADDAKNAIDSIVGKSISGREIYAKYALPQNKNRFRNLNNNQNQFPNNFKKGFYGMPNNYNSHFNIRNGGAPPNFYYPPPPPNGSFYAPPPPPPQSIQTANGNSPAYFKPNPQAAAFFPNLNNRNIKPFYPTSIPLNGQPLPQSQQQSQQQQQQHSLQQQQQQQQLRGFNPHYPRSKEEKQRKLEKGVPSTTTIFVGNLDRNVTVDDLREFMKELSPQWVKVPRKTLPNDVYKMLKANGVQIQNKGIAFVRFDNEENQKQAIELFNGKDWNGKKLNVTVAINSNDESSTTATPTTTTTNNDYDNDNEAVEDPDQAEAEAENGEKLGDSQSVHIEIEGEPSQVEEAASEIVETAVEEAEDDDDDVEIEVVVSESAAQ
ncbi:hypothetical protein PMKS-001746 [Pichia membranifaciens]|uniref:RRM domain-containing protein n=1 Tax=Pichia membranifaciens TaxID=4926 RepID=A0A1Q2YFD0_9ASCO|nr:hypothetical protein PMKS-001746 [Pichia membranifaciens]